MMEDLNPDSKKIFNDFFQKHVKSKSKICHINFYYDILNSLEVDEDTSETVTTNDLTRFLQH